MDNILASRSKAVLVSGSLAYDRIMNFPGNFKDCIDGARMLIGNDYEIALFTRKTALSQDDIKKMVEILVITYGESGSVIHKGDTIVRVNAERPAKVIDPTGAGDGYRAGFIAGLVNGKNLNECGKLASWTAAKAIEVYGAQEHRFQVADYES